MKFAPAHIAIVAALALSGAAMAQTAAPAAPAAAASPFTYNLTLASNYKFRGQDQNQTKTTAFKPALQGGVDWAHESGFYLGNWNSTIDWTKYLPSKNDSSVEVDVYGGYKFKAGAFDMDVGALAYVYPGASDANTTEVYVGATYGIVTAKYSSTVSKGYFGFGATPNSGKGRGTGYLNISLAQEIMPKVTFKAALGSTMMTAETRKLGAESFMDFNIGAAYDLGDGLSATAALVGATKKKPFYTFPAAVDPSGTKSVNQNMVVVMLTKTL